MSLFYIDEFINNEDNKDILINIDMINNIQNLFNITNLTEKIDDILIYLKKESNAYSIIKEIKLFLESYSGYDNSTSGDEGIYIYSDTLINQKIKGIDSNTLINYILDTNNIDLLNNDINNNKLLTTEYKNIISKSIDKILLEKKNSIVSSNTPYDLNSLDSIIPFFSASEKITDKDKQFYTFLNHVLYIGINNILNNNDSQLLLSKYSIDNQIYMESINFALNTTSLTYTNQDYFILVSYINELFQYAVPFLIDYKNKVLMNGYPTYWITYATILRLFLDKKVLLQNIATYNNFELFYDSNEQFNDSILFK